MTVETTRHRTIQFACDGCNTRLDTERFDFRDARDVLTAQGWRTSKDGERWVHFCEEC